MQEVVSNRVHNQVEEEAEDEVFRQIYIPRTLEEVIDYEQDIEKAGRGDQVSKCIICTRDAQRYKNSLCPMKHATNTALFTPVVLLETDGSQVVVTRQRRRGT